MTAVAARQRPALALAVASVLCALAVASVWWTKLALAIGFLTFLAALVLPNRAGSRRGIAIGMVALSAAASAVGIVRFVVLEAAPGMIQGGRARTAQHAVSRLREILRAQDAMRKYAHVDPDGDAVGSAALIGELSGHVPLRGRRRLDPPILSPRHYAQIDETPIGPAALLSGYYFVVCLPAPGGGLTARPGDTVDEERAERRFVAYAWPAAAGGGPHEAFFIDEHERILVHENLEAGSPRFAGQFFPPACDSALGERGAWRPWRDKQPRSELPHDRPGN